MRCCLLLGGASLRPTPPQPGPAETIGDIVAKEATLVPAAPVTTVLEAALEVVRTPPPTTGPLDGGPAVLAGLVASLGDSAGGTDRALAGWLLRYQRGAGHTGLVDGGLAGLAAGAWGATPARPRMTEVATRVREQLATRVPVGTPPTSLRWSDYDVLYGPAGVVLTLAAAPDAHRDHVLPAAGWLAALCDTDDLRRARVTAYQDDPVRGWNTGRVNLGLGHGVPGVAAALRAALEITGPREDLTAALGRIVRFLERESYLDDRGVRTWPPGSRGDNPPAAGTHGRQGWCYGTPGVAWVLWEAGRVLADPGVQGFATDAMESLCRAWDDDLHVDPGPPEDSLAFCHGLAGVLLVAGAFDRYAGSGAAAGLRAHVRDLLVARLDEVRQLARRDLSHLTGAGGVLSALLTDAGGERSWLRPYALR